MPTRTRTAVEAQRLGRRWYRRAYFDDGTPLGSKESDECRIDSIAQSWSVLSGAGDPARRAQACARSRSSWCARTHVCSSC
jgi:cellobiose phosphorylase